MENKILPATQSWTPNKRDARRAFYLKVTSLRNFPIPFWHGVAAGALTLALGCTLVWSNKSLSEDRRKELIAIPALENIRDADIHIAEIKEDIAPQRRERKIIVKKGDNLSRLFKRAGLNDNAMFSLLNSDPKNKKRLASLYPGDKAIFTYNDDNSLYKLVFVVDELSHFAFTEAESGYIYSETQEEPDIQLAQKSATIKNSLFEAGKSAKLDDKLVMELAAIFGWDVDFALDIRSGDSFKVVYEEQFLDGKKIGNGNIVAAEFTNKSKTYRAVRYQDREGSAQYYTPEGKTMRKAFLRTPIDFARISSHFNLKRKHPVLNYIRAHKGTDYAAVTGTPIKSTGDGKVIFAGKKGGYGNVVIVQHGQAYKTLYAHISKFRRGIRKGAKVKQGQVIAYVGSTGLVSGPHLHYEFHVNGAVRNPVTVKLPKAQSVDNAEIDRFFEQTRPYIAELQPSQSPATRYASNESRNDTKKL